MPIKNLTLGLGLVLCSTALAQNQTYRVKQGDTLSGIANRFHVRTTSIVSYNGLKANKPLKVGREIIIPLSGKSVARSSDPSSKKSVPSPSTRSTGGYAVHAGDHDVKIAKKYGLTLGQLHALNPGVDWRSLQIGQALRVTGGSNVVAAKATSKSSAPGATAPSGNARYHVVAKGENDWVIAHHVGINTVALKRLNPGVNLARLQPGQKIRVPGTSAASTAVASHSAPRLRSRYAVISGDGVAIRRGASKTSDSITRVDSGTRVTVLDRNGDWYRLRFPKGTEGWVRGDFLKASSAPAVAARPKTSSYVASSSRGKRSSKVKPTSQRESTQRVVAFQKSTSGKADGSQILAKAQTYRGVRYRWGAMSRSATDCSGFTSQVFSSQGYRIPRTSSAQSRAGIPVNTKDLKAGDLVFFRTRRGARVTHVGIYMGHGKFIHASSGGGKVQINSMSDGYYKQRFVTARRVAKKPAIATKTVAQKASVATQQAPAAEPADTTPTITHAPDSPTPDGDGN